MKTNEAGSLLLARRPFHMNFAYYCKKFFSLFYLGKTGLAAMAAGSILMCGFGSVGGPYTWNAFKLPFRHSED